MINQSEVFSAVRRGYNDLEVASNTEILNYFDEMNIDSMIGHISNIKGIVFEQEYLEMLNKNGVSAELFDTTNHPVTDIAITHDDMIVNELQLKATDSVSYINTTLEENPDVVIVSTSEVANNIDSIMVIDSGIDNLELTDIVTATLSGEVINDVEADIATETFMGDSINPISPISIIGWFFGLPF